MKTWIGKFLNGTFILTVDDRLVSMVPHYDGTKQIAPKWGQESEQEVTRSLAQYILANCLHDQHYAGFDSQFTDDVIRKLDRMKWMMTSEDVEECRDYYCSMMNAGESGCWEEAGFNRLPATARIPSPVSKTPRIIDNPNYRSSEI